MARVAKLVSPNDNGLLRTEDAAALYLTAREAMLGLALGRAVNGGSLGHEQIVVRELVRLAEQYDAGA